MPFDPDRLRTLRTMAKLTQAQLATATDRSNVVISQYENGRVVPSGPALEKLAAALNVQIDALFDKAPVSA